MVHSSGARPTHAACTRVKTHERVFRLIIGAGLMHTAHTHIHTRTHTPHTPILTVCWRGLGGAQTEREHGKEYADHR